MKDITTYDNNFDDPVDKILLDCLDLEKPKSFFLYAGAGSGKTRSLVKVLDDFRNSQGNILRTRRQKIATITYTNAACDEIRFRLDNDTLFHVSTIHSFAWELIRHYTVDIKEWLKVNLAAELAELETLLTKGRKDTKTSIDRQKKIASKTKRLEDLVQVTKFTYNPNSNSLTKDSLNHSEVIKICAAFISTNELMQSILITQYPILFIDESQDTKKELIDAILILQTKNSTKCSVGLFGDTMQRIYSDGKKNIEYELPKDWITPAKKINHRCPKRVVELLNKIRSYVDSNIQLPRVDSLDGKLKLFIVDAAITGKKEVEESIFHKMYEITDDKKWIGDQQEIKTLTLEHHMAAKRMGFENLFMPLYFLDQTSLLDGSLKGIKFFTHFILPLVHAFKNNDEFAIMNIIKQHSSSLNSELLKVSKNQIEEIEKAEINVKELLSLWKDDNDPKLIDILYSVDKSNLFPIPNLLKTISSRTQEEQILEALDEEIADKSIQAWDKALEARFSEIESYNKYVTGKAQFGTHQGVKGLEFERVLVVLDDFDARGFLFNYEKLFGAKELSKSDLKNIKEGKETTVDRTRRLFYVACSRAKESLAIVLYSNDIDKIYSFIIKEKWFIEEEIEIIKNSM